MKQENVYTVDWEQQLQEYVDRHIDGDDKALDEMMDYVVELTQEAYLRGKAARKL